MKNYTHYFYDYFISLGSNLVFSKYLNMIIMLVIVLTVILFLDHLIKILIRKLSARIATGTKTKFDDILINNKLPRNAAHVPAILLFHYYVPFVFTDFPTVENIALKLVKVLGIILTLYIVRSILNSIKDFCISVKAPIYYLCE